MRTTVRFDTLARHVFPDERESRLFHWERHEISSQGVFYHYHPQFELNLIDTPSARRIIGDDESVISGTELVLISPNLPHRWELDEGHARFWLLAFSRESLGLELLARSELTAVRSLFARAERGLAFTNRTCQAVSRLIKMLENATGVRRLVLLGEILEAICGDVDAQPIASDSYHSSGVAAEYGLVAKIVAHFTGAEAYAAQRRPSLDEAAAIAKMSVPSFTRFFRRMTGDSFVSCVNRLRIARACALLEETDASILEVSIDAGFGNLSHFNRQFKRYTGVQPRAYRARCRASI
ncbi:MAG: helix-turn-helix domain-containing protein [Spirochaetota bacterium]